MTKVSANGGARLAFMASDHRNGDNIVVTISVNVERENEKTEEEILDSVQTSE